MTKGQCNHQVMLVKRLSPLAATKSRLTMTMTHWPAIGVMLYTTCITVDAFIFVGTNFRRLNKNHTFVLFKIHGNSIFLNNSYRKSLFCGYSNSRIRPSTKTMKIGTPRKLSHQQYLMIFCQGPLTSSGFSIHVHAASNAIYNIQLFKK